MTPDQALAALDTYFPTYGNWVWTVSAHAARARAHDYRTEAGYTLAETRRAMLTTKACAFEEIASCIDLCGHMRWSLARLRQEPTPVLTSITFTEPTMSSSTIDQLTLEQTQDRLMELAAEFGPEVIRSEYEDLHQTAVQLLTKAATCSDDVKRLNQLTEASRYMTMAELVRHADGLGLDRQQLWSVEKSGIRIAVPLQFLRTHSRIPQFKLGDLAYLRSDEVPDLENLGQFTTGYLEVVVAAIEHGHDYVQYQIGMLDPTGQEVEVIDEYVDESELSSYIPSEDDQPRPVRARPHLSVVKD